MGPVSDQVLGQFVANFAERLKQAPSQPEEKPLNALALAWAVIKGWLRSLFTGKRA